ncbi:hypothetical protein HHI36_007815 [Cryptolaemus montrouzieri]|uniref:Epoxide hydrolase n=1 Tax=Cryptolaemus montrouzieri TaxID=559131 RepID=A0ABD2MQP6_9CUCU
MYCYVNFRLPVNVPTAFARFKYDIIGPNGMISDIYLNLIQVTDYDGGHFAAFENPKVLADDIFNGIAKMELIHGAEKSSSK